MDESYVAIMWSQESGVFFITMRELVTRNALHIIEGQDPADDGLIGVQPTLEDARVYAASFRKKLKQVREAAV